MIEDGIHFGLPEADYHAESALGSSGLKDLLVSPLTFWVKRTLQAQGADNSTEAKDKGSAFHKRLLEGPDVFAQHYAVKPDKADYPEALDGAEALKDRCAELGLSKGGSIAKLCARIREADPDAVLWPDIMARFLADNPDKTYVSAATMAEIERHARIVEVHEGTVNAFRGGFPEVSIFWTDENGVRCKARVDYLKVRAAVDLKSFSNALGRPVDEAVGRQIAAYDYHVQAHHYMTGLEAAKAMYREQGSAVIHGNAPDKDWLAAWSDPAPHRFFFVFLETGDVPNTRIREIRTSARVGGERNAYWIAAETKIAKAKEIYLQCLEHYGLDRPWVDPQPARALEDEDMPLWALN